MAAKKLTDLQFWKNVDDLVRRIQERTASFPDDNAEKQRKRVEKAQYNFFYFARTYFPHYVTADFGAFHHEWLKKADKPGHIWACIAARHHAKTVILGIIKPVWEALYKRKRFIVFIGDNRELSQERTLAIWLEFLMNGLIRHDFGEQVRVGRGEVHDFNIKNGARFLAQGYKQPIRGKISGRNRPDYCVVDDMESHQALNPRIADDKLKYVREELYGALNKNTGSVVWLGNLTHRESALQRFVDVVDKEKPPELSYKIYAAQKRNGQPLWPAMFSLADLARIKRVMGVAGFERHYMMNPVVEGRVIKQEYFKYAPRLKEYGQVAIACDPSLGESKHSDYKAIMVVAAYGSRIHLLECWVRQASPEAMFEKWYELYEHYNVAPECEGGMWQDVLWPMLQQSAVCARKGYVLPVKRTTNSIKKEVRIEMLQPLYERGLIVHYAERDDDLNVLEEQLLNFPDAPHDDGPDALVMAIRQLHLASAPMDFKAVPRGFIHKPMP